jgi:hypothetical protein
MLKFSYRIRSAWEEAKYRFRVAAAGISQLLPYSHEVTPVGRLYATKVKPTGEREDLGLICTKVVTTVGVNWLAGVFAGTGGTVDVVRWHGSGTGVGAETVGDTNLGTGVGSRVSGSQSATGNVYTTVATVNYTTTSAITEHGVFTASTGGVLFDRSVFAAINVVNGDSIEFTYQLTLPAGS